MEEDFTHEDAKGEVEDLIVKFDLMELMVYFKHTV